MAGGQSTTNSGAQAINVEGDAKAYEDTDDSYGLDASQIKVASDATLQGIVDATSSASASTTKGKAVAFGAGR